MSPRPLVFPMLLLLMSIVAPAHARPADTLPISPDEALEVEVWESQHSALMRFLLQRVDDAHMLAGTRVAIVAADGVDGFDIDVPRRYLIERGAHVDVLAPRLPHDDAQLPAGRFAPASIAVHDPSGESERCTVDRYVVEADAAQYDAVFVPGHPDTIASLVGVDTMKFVQTARRAGVALFASGNGYELVRSASRNATSMARPPGAGDVRATAAARVFASRDAYGIPVLMGHLVDTLLAGGSHRDR